VYRQNLRLDTPFDEFVFTNFRKECKEEILFVSLKKQISAFPNREKNLYFLSLSLSLSLSLFLSLSKTCYITRVYFGLQYIKPACFFAGFLIPAGLEYCIVLAEVLTKSASQPIR